MKSKKNVVVLLRILACIMITNSHCRNIYPVSYLAIGGGFGNALFFILSGYCLADISLPFSIWYRKRLKKLFIPFLFIVLFHMIFYNNYLNIFQRSFSQIITYFINKYWFIFAIIIYYIIFYFIFSNNTIKRFTTVGALFLSIYILYYINVLDLATFSVELEGFTFIKVLFYLIIILTGGMIKYMEKSEPYIFLKKLNSTFFYFGLYLISLLTWGITYSAILLFHCWYNLQFLIHVSVFLFSYSLLHFAILIENKIKFINFFKKPFYFLSNCTLEIYLIQVTFLEYILDQPFPLNWLLFNLIAFGGGCAFHLFLSIPRIIKKK